MQNAIESIKRRDEFYYEAMRYCREREIDDPNVFAGVEYGLRHRAFRQAIEPIQKAMARIYALAAPAPMTLHSDGRIERHGDGLTDEMRNTLAKHQENIDHIAKWYAR